MSLVASSIVSATQRAQFLEKGYFIVEGVIPDDHLRMFREELDACIEHIHREMDKAGTDVIGINHRHKRYFIMNRYKETGRLGAALLSDYMAEICRTTLGDYVWLINEQYTIKCPGKDTKFSWHQDSGYVEAPHKPWVTTWWALDDMSEANGTIYVLPYDRAGTREKIEHVKDPVSNDMVGYRGSDPGVPVIVPAGSIVVFSSVCFHRSGPNTTDRLRRAYTAEYGSEPNFNGSKPGEWGLFEPFLRGGQRVSRGM